MPRFDPPCPENNSYVSGLDDAWSERLTGWVQLICSAPGHKAHSVVPGPPGGGWTPEEVPWHGTPESLHKWFDGSDNTDQDVENAARTLQSHTVGFRRRGDGVYEPVERVYRPHDEYCEFHEHRDAANRLTKVTFTCEHADRWLFLAEKDPDLVLDLYRKLLGEKVRREEIMWAEDIYVPDPREPTGWAIAFPKHTYDPWNIWNTQRGAIHSTHPANTLVKAIALMVGASILRQDGQGQLLTDANDVLCASGFGDPNRASDPAVGGFVNQLVREGRQISLGKAPAIYIGELRTDLIDGAENAWTIERGEGNRILRATFTVPDGAAVTSGAQVARLVSLRAPFASRPRPQNSKPKPQPIIGKCFPHPSHESYSGVFTAEDSWPEVPRTRVEKLPDHNEPLSSTAQPLTASAAALPRTALVLGSTLSTRRWSLGDLQQRWSLLSRWS